MGESEGLLYANTPKAKEDERLLTKAAERYRSVLAKTGDPMLRRRVLFALAQTLECSTDIAESKELYGGLAAECPDRSFGKAARRRLDDLNRPSMRDFHEWFWKQDLTPRGSGAAISPGWTRRIRRAEPGTRSSL
jgi:hypothetical protein